MKTLSSLGTGGVILAVWSKLPGFIRYGLVAGLAVVTAAEVNVIVNESVNAPSVEAGKGAQGQAQVSDPGRIILRYRRGLRVTGAEGALAADVAGKDATAQKEGATARKEGADADAMNESTEDVRAKKQRGERLTSTEELMLLKVETAEQELRAKIAIADKERHEATIKAAEASASDAMAKANIAASNYTNCLLSGLPSPGGSMDATWSFLASKDPCMASGARR